ncbi:MAG: helix-turn-helix domain-containing protein [Dehalococcoidia bacterium]|nr:helix-turn-helix domain-containing protein [Dehalococcoidia bacterium]
MTEEYLSVDQAAEYMGRSRATIWNLIRRHRLPTFKRPLDRKTYVLKADLEKVMTSFEPREARAAA